MSLAKFTDIISFSDLEIFETIRKTESELFDLRFKKATRQGFKSHKIKMAKCRLAQLKTLLTLKLKNAESKNNN